MALKRPLVVGSDGDDELADGDALFQPRLVTTVAVNTPLVIGTHDIVLVDTDSGAVTITLPSPATANTVFVVKNIGSSGNDVTIGRNGNNIEGSAADFTAKDLASYEIAADGTDWWVT